MGFFNGLGRFLQGQNVFPEKEGSRSTVSAPPSVGGAQVEKSQFVDEHGNKIVPQVTLDRIKWNRSGDRMTITAWAANHSKWLVRIDDLTILGQKRVFQKELRPGDGDQLTIYEGPVALNEHDSRARMTLRLRENDDLFENVYHVEFNRESDGKFIVEELHLDGPVRDI